MKASVFSLQPAEPEVAFLYEIHNLVGFTESFNDFL